MHYILRFGEISLKGKNRTFFEKKLRGKIDSLFPGCRIRKAGGRFYVGGEEGLDFRRLFGVVSYSPAVKVSLDYDEIEEEVVGVADGLAGPFALRASRLNKDYEYTSMELNRRLGQVVVDEYGLEVDLDDPESVIGVEIGDDAAYVYTEKVECFGGLPVGCEGRVAALIEEEKSLLSALLMMKRGCEVVPFGGDEKDVSLLHAYGCGEEFREAGLGDVGDWYVEAVVVGDTLNSFKEYDVSLPVLRPLVGFSDEEVSDLLEDYREGVC